MRRLAGASAAILRVARLDGGQHASTWRVDTEHPSRSVVVREFPPEDPGAAREQAVLRVLGGLGGLAPEPLGCDVDGRWSEHPTSLISWIDGAPDLSPGDPEAWARELGRTLARVHAAPGELLAGLPSVFDARVSPADLNGPLAGRVRSCWPQLLASPTVLTHTDYWSGNVVWHEGLLTGVVDWPGAARGPRGYDVGWCRLDLVLLHGERIANRFTAAYEKAAGESCRDVALWDRWAAARSHDVVGSWGPNYAPLGRPDLDEPALLRLHALWTERLLQRP